MSWLNWSLKLHIRLRTISFLVLSHITLVYVPWMLYSFVWSYLIKNVAHAQLYVDQTQKYFWVFYMFLESIFVLKNLKIFKICATLFWRLDSWVKPVTRPQSRAYSEALGDSLASHSTSREKDLEKFSKI